MNQFVPKKTRVNDTAVYTSIGKHLHWYTTSRSSCSIQTRPKIKPKISHCVSNHRTKQILKRDGEST